MSVINILDTAGAISLASADALDLLVAGGRQVVVTAQVFEEISRGTEHSNATIRSFYTKAKAWLDTNPTLWERVVVPINQADLDRYTIPVGGVQSEADASIAKYIEELSDSSQVFELVTDNRKDFDGTRKYQLPDRVVFDRSTAGFIANVIGDKRISEIRAVEVVDAMRASSRLDSLSDGGALLPTAEQIRNLYGNKYIQSGWLTEAALRGINTSVILGVGLEVLRQVGILGDILSFGVTAAHAADLRSQGKNEDADLVWVRYIFETSGGVAGGALGAAIGLGLGGPLGAIVGGVVLGYGVGEYGAEFGEFLYKNYKEVVQPGLDQLNQLIDAALSDDEDVSRKFAEAVVKGLGFDLTTVNGGTANDWMVARGFERRNGGGGDDLILGFDAKAIAQGQVFDAATRAQAQAIWAAYDAAIANGGTPDEPEIDRNAGVAQQEQRMLLDGGVGDDWVFALGGTGAVTVGGAGSDFLYNSSYKGQLWGDGRDGRGASAAANDRTSDDTFWWSAGSFIMDAGKNDRLQLFGLPLVGGSNALYYGIGLERAVARDFLLPWVTYGVTEAGQLLVEASFGEQLNPAMGADAILEVAQVVENWQAGDLGIEFIVKGGGDEISLFRSLFKLLGAQADAVKRFGKNLAWLPTDDPLVLDLNGDGLVSKGLGAVYFDQDGDGFAERSGWISGDDGFLVHDADGSGTIDDVSEMFGAPGGSGFAELAGWDTNADGVVDASDAGFAALKVWRDRDGDAVTDSGELYSLADLGITSLSVTPDPAKPAVTTANGTIIRAETTFTRSNGTTGALGELVFETDRVQSRYTGNRGVASWAPSYDAQPSVAGNQSRSVNAKGYGRLTDLAVAASQDLGLADTLASAQAAMASSPSALSPSKGAPSLSELRRMVQPVLASWSKGQTQSRELGAVLLSFDPSTSSGQPVTKLDHAVYVEDATGGYWTLKSGAAVLDAQGGSIARPTFEQILAQATTGGATWRAVQLWSPSDPSTGSGQTGVLRAQRPESVYLAHNDPVTGAVVIDDHAVAHKDAQGTYWTLASGRAITDAQGEPIARASLADIKALPVAAGQKWQSEAFAASTATPAPYPKIAFELRDGIVSDYSVWVATGSGAGEGYAVWLKDLVAAQGAEARYGAGSFDLAAKAIDFAALGNVQFAQRKIGKKRLLTSQTSQGETKYCEVKNRGKAMRFWSPTRYRSGVTGTTIQIVKEQLHFDSMMACRKAEYSWFQRALAA
jgi:hypothetical protein